MCLDRTHWQRPNLRLQPTVGVGLSADRKGKHSPTAAEPRRYADKIKMGSGVDG